MSIRTLTAAHLMATNVVTIPPSETLRNAAVLLDRHHIHCLVVPATEPGNCVGVIATKDIVQILGEGESAVLDQLRVADAMSTPAVSVQKDFTISDCLRLMRMSGVRSAPVLDGTTLVGMLSFSDILRAIAAEANQG